jgi:hypothetical protein
VYYFTFFGLALNENVSKISTQKEKQRNNIDTVLCYVSEELI